MDEITRNVTLTESDACRIIFALHRLSAHVRHSSAPQTRKDRSIAQNNAIIYYIRNTFQIEL